ncbi:MAG: tetratricopeptide repeat protein, partial [Thermoplasmata archaeon]|nr:tetratricopeptide repeat protein [Thermoplasmata archaeon]
MSNIKELLGKAEASFENAKYEEAKELCLKGIKKSEKSNDTASIKTTIKFLNILSDCDDMLGKWFDSTLNLERIIELAEEHKYPTEKAEAMIKVGAQLTKSGKWEKARIKFEKVKPMVEKFENPYFLGLTLSGLGEIYFRTGKVNEAIATGQEVVDIGEKIDNQSLIGKATNIIMVSWYGIGEFEKALEANLRTIEAYKKIGDNSRLAMAFNNRGSIYKILEEYDKSL